TGLPASCVSTPEFGSSRKMTIWFEAGIAAYKYLLLVDPQPIHVAMLAQTRNRAAAFFSILDSRRNLTKTKIGNSLAPGNTRDEYQFSSSITRKLLSYGTNCPSRSKHALVIGAMPNVSGEVARDLPPGWFAAEN